MRLSSDVIDCRRKKRDKKIALNLIVVIHLTVEKRANRMPDPTVETTQAPVWVTKIRYKSPNFVSYKPCVYDEIYY